MYVPLYEYKSVLCILFFTDIRFVLIYNVLHIHIKIILTIVIIRAEDLEL